MSIRNLYFVDDNSKHIYNNLLYVSGDFTNPLPGTGYWIDTDYYANDMTPYWGSWWLAYFNPMNKTVQIGFSSFNSLPTSQQIIDVITGSPTYPYTSITSSISNNVFKYGKGSLFLNSNNQEYFDIGPFKITNTGFTLACWFKTNDTGNDKRLFDFFTDYNSINNWIYLSFKFDGQHAVLDFLDNGGNELVPIILGENSLFTTNEWIHIAITINYNDGVTFIYTVYLNGKEYTSTTSNSYPTSNTYNYNYLGRNTDIYIDDFRIYDKTLNSQQINKIYNYKILNYQLGNNTSYATIFPKLLYIFGNNKIYDKLQTAYISISGIVNNDFLNYNSYFDDINVGNNKIINISLTNLNNEKNLIYFYKFDINDISNNYIYNYNINNYDALIYGNNQEYLTLDISSYVFGTSSLNINNDNKTKQSYLVIPPFILDSYSGFSISFWFKIPENTNNSYSRICCFSHNNNLEISVMIVNEIIYYYQNGSYNIQIGSVNQYINNLWHHIVITISASQDNATINIFVDNNNIFTLTSILHPLLLNYNINCIGSDSAGSGVIPFNGNIDDFRVYKRELFSNDVTNLFNNVIPLNNYELYNNVTYGSILPKMLTLNPIGINKEYDGTPYATFTYTISGIISNDFVDISSNLYYANFNDFYGQNILITISNIILYGSESNNYYISPYTFTNGNIIQKTLIVNIFNKTYDGTLNVNYSISGTLNNDEVLIYSSYDSPNVGNNLGFIALSGSLYNDITTYPSSLILYYKFDNDGKNYGSTGSYNDCTFDGTYITNSIYKVGSGCLASPRGPSTISKVYINNDITIQDKFSIAFWYYSEQGSSNGAEYITFIDTINFKYLIYLDHWDGALRIYVNYNFIGNISIISSTWMHIAITVNNTNVTVYYNNNVALMSNNTVNDTTWQNKTYDSLMMLQAGAFWDANIPIYTDDFRFYNIELTSSDVNDIYNFVPIIKIYKNNFYKLNSNVFNSTIQPLLLSFMPISTNKNYDGFTYAPITYTLSGMLFNDYIDICNNYISDFASPNIGIQDITISNLSLYGLNASNYTILSTYTLSGIIY